MLWMLMHETEEMYSTPLVHVTTKFPTLALWDEAITLNRDLTVNPYNCSNNGVLTIIQLC